MATIKKIILFIGKIFCCISHLTSRWLYRRQCMSSFWEFNATHVAIFVASEVRKADSALQIGSIFGRMCNFTKSIHDLLTYAYHSHALPSAMDDDAGVGIGLQTMNVVSEWFTQCVSTRMLLARDIAVLIKIYTLLTDHVCGFWCQRVYVDDVFARLLYKHATASSVNCLCLTLFFHFY